MTHAHLIEDIADARAFALAGRAIFTVHNTATDGRVTYRVEATDEDGVLEVRAFTGSDNSVKSSYSLLGHVRDGEYVYRGLAVGAGELKAAAEKDGDTWLADFCKSVLSRFTRGIPLTAKQEGCLRRSLAKRDIEISSVAFEDVKQRGFAWLWRFLVDEKPLPEGVQFWHEGRCGRCGRRLTVPGSIEIGFGPDCASELGITLPATA